MLTRFGEKEAAWKLLGVFQTAFSLALILEPIVAGLILKEVGPRAVFSNSAWLMGFATLLAIFLFHMKLLGSEMSFVQAESESQGFLKRFHSTDARIKLKQLYPSISA